MGMAKKIMIKSFDPEVEKLYLEFLIRDSLPVIRLTLISSALFFVLSGLIDTLVSENLHNVMAILQYGVLVPVLMLVYFFTYRVFFVRNWQKILLAMVMLNGATIMYMIASMPGNLVNYAELMFVFVTGCYFLRLRSWFAILAMWLFTFVFIGVMALDEGTSSGYVLFYSLIFVSANIIIMAASIYNEAQSRKIFILNLNRKRFCQSDGADSFRFSPSQSPSTGYEEDHNRPDSDPCPLMVFEVDFHGKITYANGMALKKTGLSANEIGSGVLLTGLFLPEERTGVIARIKGEWGRIEDGNPAYTIIGSQRTFYYVRVFSIPILKEGNAIGRRIILEDITGQIKAERALKEVEERYNLIANDLFDGFFIYGDGVLEYASSRLCAILEYEESDLLDKSFDLSRLLTKESFIPVKETISTKPAQKRTSQRVELKAITKTGTVRDVEVVLVQLPKGQGQQLFGVVRDITELKIAESLRYEPSLTSHPALFKEQFMTNISHEIRTQVAGIVGIIEVLSGAIRNVKHSEYIQILESSTDKLIRAINQIIAFSDKEAGSADTRPVMRNNQKAFSNRHFDRSAGTMKSLRILVVEDKQMNQKVIELILNSMGHSVTIAGNGMQALKIFTPDAFDLILMDIKMPVMDGITAAIELRKKHRNLPPIVGLSASPFTSNYESYAKIGMDEYLTKPMRKEDFVLLIKNLGI